MELDARKCPVIDEIQLCCVLDERQTTVQINDANKDVLLNYCR